MIKRSTDFYSVLLPKRWLGCFQGDGIANRNDLDDDNDGIPDDEDPDDNGDGKKDELQRTFVLKILK